jgi:hypothetical protein
VVFMDKRIESFITEISALNEEDYGDFMRLANLFFIQLRKELRPLYNHEINMKLDYIQNYLQFRPSWDIASTKKNLLHDLVDLDGILHSASSLPVSF